ncbi:MAG: hypothetical protein Q7T66_01290 [Herminiimonas sp.]|uniref:hypothetical protein n=1 Tax=Herminiimonas sp. TaxID=1926289 RepID=UPI002722C875|nr:hypothetical protein [Herminiimonas sp.]MDO9419273.1 hypothetical protein [Herminiimonas sp.]
MARHRVGNTYLSDDEKSEHDDTMWAGKVFIVGALIGGCVVHELIKPLAFAKWGIFISVIVGALVLGSIFSTFRNAIAFCLRSLLYVAVIGLLGFLIWKIL